jgi:hypothetical protein
VIEASLRVRLPCSWVTLLTVEHGASVSVVEQKSLGGGLLQSLVEIETKGADPEALLQVLRRNPYVADVQAIIPSKGRLLATVQVRECRACDAVAESECFLTDATAAGGEGVEWHLLAPDRRAVQKLAETLTGRGLDVHVTALRSMKTAGLLTDRQDAVVRLAYRLGFFEFPKKVSLTELAGKLGISKSTLSETLRAAEAKILHTYFQGLLKTRR